MLKRMMMIILSVLLCVSLLGGQSFTMKFKFIADKGV